MTKLEYWEESIASSFDEHGITASKEQITAIAKDLQHAQECMGMAFYSPPKERRMVTCKDCNGNGYYTSYGPYHSSIHTCDKCKGRGRHL